MEFVVDARGNGDFRSVGEAIAASPEWSTQPVTIHIRKGVYEEKLRIPKEKTNIRLIGEDPVETILTYSDNARMPLPDGTPMGTFRTGSLSVFGNGFTAENLTIRNSSGPGTGQAVALFLDADKAVLRGVRLLGDQDTLYTGNGRQYYYSCYIEGDVDFIFGPSTAVFDRCHIHCKRSGGYLTAASTPEDVVYGYVFLDCMVTGAPETSNIYLGRPWRDFANTVFIRTWMDGSIHPKGWHNWGQPHREETSRYKEFGSRGPGATLADRVPWAEELYLDYADAYTPERILSGKDGWGPL